MEPSVRIAFPSDFASVFRHDDSLQARPVMAIPEPSNIRADPMAARFNSPVICVNGFELLDEIPANIPPQLDFVHYAGKQSAYSSRMNRRI